MELMIMSVARTNYLCTLIVFSLMIIANNQPIPPGKSELYFYSIMVHVGNRLIVMLYRCAYQFATVGVGTLHKKILAELLTMRCVAKLSNPCTVQLYTACIDSIHNKHCNYEAYLMYR